MNVLETPITELWIEWSVEPAPDELDMLQCYEFKLTRETYMVDSQANLVRIPLVLVSHHIEEQTLLHFFRNKNHKPRDPWELVRFINMLAIVVISKVSS